jgi:hypothetical protein
MSIRKPRWLLAAAPAVVLAVTLTACGSGSDSDEETTDESGSGAETGAQEDGGREPAGEGAEAGGGSSESQNQNQDQEAGGGTSLENGAAVEVELGEASGSTPYGDGGHFDATVERFEPGTWEDLEGSPVFDEGYQGLDPYYVEMSLTNLGDSDYKGGHPSADLHVLTDDGGPFETVEAMDAANLPEWCEYVSPSASTTIEPGETVSECQVVLVGHGVGALSVEWWAGHLVNWTLN